MNTQDNNKEREDQPRDINPDKANFKPSANKLHAKDKIDIKESVFGRDFSNFQQDEHIEDSISQVDEGTIKLQEQKKESTEESRNEINDNDDRDHNDSTQDWDAENSRTGRHK